MFDEDVLRPKAAHEIGMDLSTLSEHELAERVEVLKTEIARLETELASKGSSRAAAESLFSR